MVDPTSGVEALAKNTASDATSFDSEGFKPIRAANPEGYPEASCGYSQGLKGIPEATHSYKPSGFCRRSGALWGRILDDYERRVRTTWR